MQCDKNSMACCLLLECTKLVGTNENHLFHIKIAVCRMEKFSFLFNIFFSVRSFYSLHSVDVCLNLNIQWTISFCAVSYTYVTV